MSETQPQTLAQKLEAAKAAAAASVPAAPAGSPAVGTAVAVAAGGGARQSLAAVVASSFSVDKYIKVSKDGFGLVLEGKLILEPIDVLIDLSEVIPHTAIKGGPEGNVSYEKSYDGIMAKSGKTWAQAIENIQKVSPGARPYEAFDICLTPVEDVRHKDQVVAEAGERLGYATSTTNKANWVAFCKKAAAAGVDLNTGKVFAKVGAESKTNGKHTWGLMTFEFIAPATEQ